MKGLRLWNNDPWGSFRGLSELQRNMDQMFDTFVSPSAKLREISQAAYQPLTDLEETEGHYHLSIDLPGVPKENLKIEINNGLLSVYGERKEERKGKDKEGARFVERTYGEFRREFALPKTVNAEKVDAHFDNGVLHITIPKSEAAKPRQIPINEGRAAAKTSSTVEPTMGNLKKVG